MKLSFYCRLVFLVLLTVLFATIVKPMPAYAMACCKDLNCEGNYYDCVSSCVGVDQACMDSCRTTALSCARTLCDVLLWISGAMLV